MKLNEQIIRIQQMMNITLTESKPDLKSGIQKLIDRSLEGIREESEDWGLGEMDEIDEINSVDSIVVKDIVRDKLIRIYVDINTNSQRIDFDNVMAAINDDIKKIIGNNTFIQLNNIVDNRTFGPGIDW